METQRTGHEEDQLQLVSTFPDIYKPILAIAKSRGVDADVPWTMENQDVQWTIVSHDPEEEEEKEDVQPRQSKRQRCDSKVTPAPDSDTSTGSCIPAPGSTEVLSEFGSGGCFAVALSALKMLGDSKEAVSAKLDAQIELQHQEFNEQRATKAQPPYDRRRVGVEGQHWHSEVIRRALKGEYGQGGYVFKKAKFNKSGTYIIDGILNRSYVHKAQGRRTRLYHPGHDVAEPDDNWRHCIAVNLSKGKFYCIGAGGWAPIADLWLDNSGQPDRKKGYMKKILKV